MNRSPQQPAPSILSDIDGPNPSGRIVGGWVLVLCILLIVGHPFSFALVAASAMNSLYVRGIPLALVLVTRLIVTSVGVAAGVALLNGRPGAVTLAQIALAFSAVMDLFVYTTPFFPNNRMPGDTPFYVAASITYHSVWMIYLFKSRRVKGTFEP